MNDAYDRNDIEAEDVADITFQVILRKTTKNSRLGVAVDPSDGVCLVVDKVEGEGGLMGEWNNMNPDRKVEPGDKIVACNGASGTAQDITVACKNSDTLEMTVVKK